MSYTISPSAESLARALDSWQWIGIQRKTPILVTSLADVFFDADGEIWFLDTLEGTFRKSHESREDLESALRSDAGKDHFLSGGFVDRALREGLLLDVGQCYDFKLHPVVGGAMEYDNIEIQDFAVALHIRGQIHEQARYLPDGTRISKFVVVEEGAEKPWWKLLVTGYAARSVSQAVQRSALVHQLAVDDRPQ